MNRGGQGGNKKFKKKVRVIRGKEKTIEENATRVRNIWLGTHYDMDNELI